MIRANAAHAEDIAVEIFVLFFASKFEREIFFEVVALF
jgi:hypothetical protein